MARWITGLRASGAVSNARRAARTAGVSLALKNGWDPRACRGIPAQPVWSSFFWMLLLPRCDGRAVMTYQHIVGSSMSVSGGSRDVRASAGTGLARQIRVPVRWRVLCFFSIPRLNDGRAALSTGTRCVFLSERSETV